MEYTRIISCTLGFVKYHMNELHEYKCYLLQSLQHSQVVFTKFKREAKDCINVRNIYILLKSNQCQNLLHYKYSHLSL